MGLYCPWITIVLPLGKISRERGIERERDRIEERGHYVAAAFTLPNCISVLRFYALDELCNFMNHENQQNHLNYCFYFFTGVVVTDSVPDHKGAQEPHSCQPNHL